MASASYDRYGAFRFDMGADFGEANNVTAITSGPGLQVFEDRGDTPWVGAPDVRVTEYLTQFLAGPLRSWSAYEGVLINRRLALSYFVLDLLDADPGQDASDAARRT